MECIAVNEVTTQRWSFEEDVQRYAAAGVEAIGVWRQKLSDFGEAKGAELLRETGLTVSSLNWVGGFTGSEGRTHQETIDDARDALRLAHDLGARNVVVYTGSRAGHTHNHARRLVKSALQMLSPIAEELGICLTLEVMNAECSGECTFLTDLDDALAMLASVESTAVKLLLDTYQLGFCSKLQDRLPELVPHVGLVHLGDGKQVPTGEQNRCLLGEGIVPVGEIVEQLLAHGYAGFFEIELFGEDVETIEYEDVIAASLKTAQEWVVAGKPN